MEDERDTDLLKMDLDLVNLSEMERESILLKTVNENESSTSSGNGFCVKQYEEKMDNLKKENFNLRLRLYFYEEKNGTFPEGTESLHKAIIDLKVENEELNKAVDEKQELLMQASQALELFEKEARIEKQNAEKSVNDLNLKIEMLEEEKNALQQALAETNKSTVGDDTGYADFFGMVDSKDNEMQRRMFDLSQLSENLQQQLDTMSRELKQLKDARKNCETNHSTLKYERDELVDKVAKAEADARDSQRKSKMFQEMLNERGRDLQFLQDQNDRLFRTNKKLNERYEELEYSQFELSIRAEENQENKLMIIEKLEKEVAEYKEKWAAAECDILDLKAQYEDSERERKKTLHLLKKSIEKSKDDQHTIEKLEQAIKEQTSSGVVGKEDAKKDAEILALKEEVATIQKKLVHVTSTELKEKKNEIEYLTSLLNKMKIDQQSVVANSSRASLDHLFDDFNELKFQQAMEVKKQSQHKIEELLKELFQLANANTQNQVQKIREEMRIVNEKQLITDSALNRCYDLCLYTFEHLNELTMFLSTLLEQRDFRDSLSDQSIMKIRNIIVTSLDLSQRNSITGRLSSMPHNLSNFEAFVQTARNSIANIRELQDIVKEVKLDKSVQFTMQCEKCNEMKAKFEETVDEYEQLKRVNQLLEDEIQDAKNIIESKDNELTSVKEENQFLKDGEDELNVLLEDCNKTIQKLQVDKINLESKWQNSNEKVLKLQTRLDTITSDLETNWITKVKHEIEVNKLQEEIVNLEAQVAAIRMEFEELRRAADTVNTIAEENKENDNCIFEENSLLHEKNNVVSRRTIEISDDRKMLLLAAENSSSTSNAIANVCDLCPKYQNQIRELKKYLGKAISKLEKQSEQKAIVDRHIQNQLHRTENFLQQARFNMENIIKNKEQKE